MRRSGSDISPVLAALARGVLGEGYVHEVPARIEETLALVASSADRRDLQAALRLIDTRAGALVATGRPVPVSWLTPSEAEALLQTWQTSRLPMLRRLGGMIIALALSALYAHPGKEWDRIGYPGPLGGAPGEPKRLSPLDISEDTELSCDVVVVGSGAGGGCAAATFAATGLDVIVLEKGGYFSERDFDHVEAHAMRDLYLYGMTLSTSDFGCRILAGSTLGGGTLVNYSTSFRTPPTVLQEWARESGIDGFVSGEMDESLDEVSARLGVNRAESVPGRRDELMELGLTKLGWHVDVIPRATRGCSQDAACGYCGFGCRLGAKQSTLRTYLEDAAADGARIVVGADARRVEISEGRATGVEARVGRHKLRVRARAVVAAGGSIETPALLLRSGLGGQVGMNLHLHPGSAAWGIFDDEVRPWEGTLQARYSLELAGGSGGYGSMFETVPVHPGSGSTALPWLSASKHRERMAQYKNVSFCAVLPRDRTSGRVRIARDGNPVVHYKLDDEDQSRIADGVVAAAQVLEAAGATEIFAPHADVISYRPDVPGAHDRWADETRRRGYGKGQVTFFSFHQMGSCRMGVDPSRSAIGPDNESHEVPGLFVLDGSAFPTASGVNPMLSIYGIANRGAKKIAARLS